jgi:hypothetical protein
VYRNVWKISATPYVTIVFARLLTCKIIIAMSCSKFSFICSVTLVASIFSSESGYYVFCLTCVNKVYRNVWKISATPYVTIVFARLLTTTCNPNLV